MIFLYKVIWNFANFELSGIFHCRWYSYAFFAARFRSGVERAHWKCRWKVQWHMSANVHPRTLRLLFVLVALFVLGSSFYCWTSESSISMLFDKQLFDCSSWKTRISNSGFKITLRSRRVSVARKVIVLNMKTAYKYNSQKL